MRAASVPGRAWPIASASPSSCGSRPPTPAPSPRPRRWPGHGGYSPASSAKSATRPAPVPDAYTTPPGTGCAPISPPRTSPDSVRYERRASEPRSRRAELGRAPALRRLDHGRLVVHVLQLDAGGDEEARLHGLPEGMGGHLDAELQQPLTVGRDLPMLVLGVARAVRPGRPVGSGAACPPPAPASVQPTRAESGRTARTRSWCDAKRSELRASPRGSLFELSGWGGTRPGAPTVIRVEHTARGPRSVAAAFRRCGRQPGRAPPHQPSPLSIAWRSWTWDPNHHQRHAGWLAGEQGGRGTRCRCTARAPLW